MDQWLEHGSINRYRLHDFIDWATARELTANPLHVPRIRKAAPSQRLDDDQRWGLLQRCLHDEDIELRLRVAAALVLLFGQVPSRIVKLTTADITVDQANTFLTLDAQPVLLPPRLATLLTRLATERSTGRRPVIEQRTGPARLLFPGSRPGQPTQADSLSTALNQQLGLPIRQARNAALSALADDLPASVLADLLGLHIGTAVSWVRLARRDWTDYLAARAETSWSTART